MIMGVGLVAGKLALVTGARSGIGRTVCQILAREGAKVTAIDQNGLAAQETQAINEVVGGVDHLSVTVDVPMAESINLELANITEHYKQAPSLLVNSAGITKDGFILRMDEHMFQKVIDINLKGTFLMNHAAVKAMVNANITRGSIINLASIVGKTGNIGQCNYTASKAGVEALTKTAAKKFGKLGVRCTAVLPGFMKSPMTGTIPDKVKDLLLQGIPMRRMGRPDEIAEVITFLSSNRSSYVNGASIEVTGG